MAVTVHWHGEQVKRDIQRQLDKGVRAVTKELHRMSRMSASVVNPGRRMRRTRATSRGKKGSQYTTYPHSSRPGEAPRRRTGFGQKNIVWGFHKGKHEGRVGYTRNARYMAYHELGIRYRHQGFQRRPTIMPALRQNMRRLSQIMQRASGGTGGI